MNEIKNGEQIQREKAERGPLSEPIAPVSGLPALQDDADLENQLAQARRIVCTPGQPSPACALLVRMSLLLAEDVGAEQLIRDKYAELAPTIPPKD